MLLDGDIEYSGMTAHIKSLLDLQPGMAYTVSVIDVGDNAGLDALIRFLQKTSVLKHSVMKGGRLVLVFDSDASAAIAQLENAVTAAPAQRHGSRRSHRNRGPSACGRAIVRPSSDSAAKFFRRLAGHCAARKRSA